jgi:S-ribosylhomocysteine lyase LuxS involved in autoinducer biosynthesis
MNCNSRIIIRAIKTRRMVWTGHVASLGIRTGLYRILAEKPEEKKTLAILGRRQEDNIKVDLQNKSDAGCGLDWSGLG